MPQGTALSGSPASSKVGLEAFSHSFLCPCDCARFIEEGCAQSSITMAHLCTVTMEAVEVMLQCS